MNQLCQNPLAIGTDSAAVQFGGGKLGIIAGPCVIDGFETCDRIAAEIDRVANALDLPIVFKASFDKANRTRIDSYRGLGLEKGLEILAQIRSKYSIPVTTDVHLPEQIPAVAKVCDLIQIPAFLARQTDLLVAAGKTGKPVNVKKGQFMAPWDMQHVVGKLEDSGCRQMMLTERGTFFGYATLVNDMRSIVQMKAYGYPVVFDATHSVQQPSAKGGTTGGQREMVAPLAKAAVAVGCDVVFLETHPDPDQSPSDGPNMLPLDQFADLVKQLQAIHQCVS